MEQLGRIERRDPREAWASESDDFTPWLAANIELLADALGVGELEVEGTEIPVGGFRLDLLARESGPAGRRVAVENQLERSDHSHLGQSLLYAAGVDAQIVVWICTEIRDEYRQALEWLNDHTLDDVAFFGIEVEVLQIGDSERAPNFRAVVSPSEFARASREPGQAVSGKRAAYRDFWEEFLERLQTAAPGFSSRRRTTTDNWITFSSGTSGFGLTTSFFRDGFRVELYIDKGDVESNQATFDELLLRKAEVERELGEPLSWDRLETRRASRIYVARLGDVLDDASTLAEIQEWGIKRLLAFKRVFGPLVADIE